MAFFQAEGNFLVVIDKLTMWVIEGKISALINLIIEVSIWSRPKALALFKLEILSVPIPGRDIPNTYYL